MTVSLSRRSLLAGAAAVATSAALPVASIAPEIKPVYLSGLAIVRRQREGAAELVRMYAAAQAEINQRNNAMLDRIRADRAFYGGEQW